MSLGGAALPYAVPSAADYHLTGGPAVDLIPTSSLVVTKDIDGQSRPQGAAADAGADEMTGTTPAPTPTPTATSTASDGDTDAEPDREALPRAGRLGLRGLRRGTPCRSLNRAYRVVAPGQTVEVAAGTDTPTARCRWTRRNRHRGRRLRPRDGRDAELHRLRCTSRARHLELRGMRFQGTLWIDETAQDVTLRSNTTGTSRSSPRVAGAARHLVHRRQRGAVGGRQQPHRVQRAVDDRLADEHPDRRHGVPRLHVESGFCLHTWSACRSGPPTA